ncbi:MAG: hypothetical protein E7J30_10440 [Veillonella parvula]|nr:hypothetical protein [Veillonella parvula]
MRLFVKFVLLGIVGVCSVVLSGCSFIWTTENGDPATPEDIKSSVEKEFSVVHPNLVLQSSVVEKEKCASESCSSVICGGEGEAIPAKCVCVL